MCLSSIVLATVLWSSSVLCSPNPPPPPSPSHTVSTPYAKYSGAYTAPYSLAFLGVPYAEPPTGNQRFRAPKSLNTHRFNPNTVIDASNYPNFCVQSAFGPGDPAGAGSEDCLNVNIYTPFNATSHSRLPVLVYIHGGGYIEGNPRNWPFEHWINQSPNVIIVSVYYRLGALGFMTHPSFSNPFYGDSNAGFLDQVEALKWVKRYISYFGGDPDQVTINGESAGGGSIQLHLVSPLSQGLFDGAIAQSVYRSSMPSASQQLPIFNYLASQAGCSGSTSAILGCLRSLSTDAFARAQDASVGVPDTGYTGWRPSLDGKAFTDYPTKLIQQGRFSKVPTIVGATSNETFTGPGQPFDSAMLMWYPSLTPTDISQLQTLYNGYSWPDTDSLVANAVGEVLLRCPREIIGKAIAQNSNKKVWTYRYNQPNPTFSPPGKTEHAAENWMMFLGVSTGVNGSAIFHGLDPVQTAFSQELIAYWLSFVRSFNPNSYKLSRSPVWPDYDPGFSGYAGKRIVLQQDINNSTTSSSVVVELEPRPEIDRCKYIADHSEHQQT